jgi:hypothetical protein
LARGLSPRASLVTFVKGPLRKDSLILPERSFNEWRAERAKKTKAGRAKARELRDRLSTDIMPVAKYRQTAVLPSQRGRGFAQGQTCFIRTASGGYDATLAGRDLDLYWSSRQTLRRAGAPMGKDGEPLAPDQRIMNRWLDRNAPAGSVETVNGVRFLVVKDVDGEDVRLICDVHEWRRWKASESNAQRSRADRKYHQSAGAYFDKAA